MSNTIVMSPEEALAWLESRAGDGSVRATRIMTVSS